MSLVVNGGHNGLLLTLGILQVLTEILAFLTFSFFKDTHNNLHSDHLLFVFLWVGDALVVLSTLESKFFVISVLLLLNEFLYELFAAHFLRVIEVWLGLVILIFNFFCTWLCLFSQACIETAISFFLCNVKAWNISLVLFYFNWALFSNLSRFIFLILINFRINQFTCLRLIMRGFFFD